MIAYTGKPECDIRDVLIAELTSQRDKLLSALEKSRYALEIANEIKNGPINDTIWMPQIGCETLFDFMDAAIASAKGGA